ncbi:MAG: hypothetical protein V7K39_19520 [Nostoc sp.]
MFQHWIRISILGVLAVAKLGSSARFEYVCHQMKSAIAPLNYYANSCFRGNALMADRLAINQREFDGTKKWQEVVQANLLGKCQLKVF